MVEVVVTLAIFAILVGIATPAMQRWVAGSKAKAAVGFYAEGLSLARQQAMRYNSASRFVLIPNASNGQYDWRVDICVPTTDLPCDVDSSGWSTTDSAAGGDLAGSSRSVLRVADGLPASTILATGLSPAGSDSVYFDSRGWVDTTFPGRITSMQFTPGTGFETAFPSGALMISLGGTATACNPNVAATDSRGCPR